ncbi:hypothetical protein HPT27_06750 [Permianibacter sp. IMCC34836]|uniref:hypothetical protein n=1 Tax=Permianibacter fluminis TaxID=2738515 RepID=UPI0015561DD4|nr:hypothetical protein [Permianibacter fluminis]NQD36719.1 hypothetical protein [Permianibacter fluminis]
MKLFNPPPTTLPATPASRPTEPDRFRQALAQQSIGMLAAGGYFSPALAKQLLTAGQTDGATAPAPRRAAPMLVGRQAGANSCPSNVCCA